MAERQHRETLVTPAGRGTIFDRTGVQLAIGEQTTTVYADPTQLVDPRAVAVARTPGVRRRRERALPAAAEQEDAASSTSRASPTRSSPRRSSRRTSPASNSYPEERRDVPAAHGRRPGGRLRRHRQHGARRARARVQQAARGKPGKQTIVRDPFGRAIDVVSSTPEREGHDIFTTLDHTIQANAEPVLR